MFYKLILRNSARSRKENGLYFSSLLVSIVAFYIILSLPRQDVMLFLKKMESHAVDRLMTMIPVFFCVTLFLLFFLIYFAGKYQMDRRRHEFGVYLVMGMRRSRLFVMLLAEELGGSFLSLLLGIPAAVLLAELISLVTARFVGLGIIGHRFTFSPEAVVGTAVGFGLIKLLAFLVLSGRIAGQETAALLTEKPSGTKAQLPSRVYRLAIVGGIVCLGTAYWMAISGIAWIGACQMGITLLMGVAGTELFFFGLRAPLGFLAKHSGRQRRLGVFHFRQIQEQVIDCSHSLAVCSLLVLAAMCCFGAGAGMAGFYGSRERHVLDYTFTGYVPGKLREKLAEKGLDAYFSQLIEVREGHISTAKEAEPFRMDSVMEALVALEDSREKSVLLNNLRYATDPYMIAVSGYNQLLAAAGEPVLELGESQAGVYMDGESTPFQNREILNRILAEKPEVVLSGTPLHLTGEVQTVDLVTDRAVSLSFALIVPDEVFDEHIGGSSVYLNGILNRELFEDSSLMGAIMQMNEKLDEAGLNYESYLQNMGRSLFFLVAGSYLTVYLAIIFLLMANTVIGVQFLMGQRKSGRRYQTLIRLGATHGMLRRCVGNQILWYFGIPVLAAACSSIFGVRSLFAGLLPTMVRGNVSEMIRISAAVILVVFMIELIYITAVRRSSSRYLLTLMVPEREE